MSHNATCASLDVSSRTSPAVTCRNPADIGLIKDNRGVWRSREGLANAEANTGQLQSLAQRPVTFMVYASEAAVPARVGSYLGGTERSAGR